MKVFTDADFADAPKTFSESDFQDAPNSQPTPSVLQAGMQGIQAVASPLLFASTPAGQNLGRGLALQGPTPDAGMVSRFANSVGQQLPPAVGAMLGAAGGTVLGMGVGSIPGAAIGGAAGRSVQEAASSALNGGIQPKQVLMNVGVAGAANGLMQGAGELAGAALGKIGPRVYDYLATSKIGGGIAQPAWDYFKHNVESVLGQISSAPEDADAMANDLRAAIANSAQALEDKYRAGLQAIRGRASAPNVDMSALADTINQAVDRDFGYFSPGRTGGSADAQFFKTNVSDRLAQMASANPNEVLDFQKDLNNFASDNYGSSLGAALQKAKSIVRPYVNQQIPELAGMNEAWAAAQDLRDQAAKLTGANDLVGFVKRVFNNPLETLQKQSLESVAGQVPEVAQGLKGVRSYLAAQSVKPLLRSMTGTGGETGLAAAGLAGYAVGHPAALAAAPLLPVLSPRAYALGYAYGPQAVAAVAPGATAAIRMGLQTPLAAEALKYMSPESLSTYYGR